MSDIHVNRLARVAEALDRADIDLMLLGPEADTFYLTGFEHGHAAERLLAFIVRRDGSAAWISPSMNVAQIQKHASPNAPIYAWTDAETYLPALREVIGDARAVAFDDEARAAFLLDLLEVAPGIRPVKAGAFMRRLRVRKDADELRALRHAATQVDQAIAEAVNLCRATRRESEVDQELRRLLGGDEQVAFTIVAAGKNSALPHHETGPDTLEPGDIVILDFGTRYRHYHSDITVTCSVGEPADPEARQVYRIVWEAQQKALEAIRPGVPCEAIDRAAREHIAAAGYGDFFLHRTGHGLGLQVHEPPYLVAGNTEPLEEGMVFSVEPGIYLPGRFGVRLEVITAVGSTGAELINAPSAPELPIAPQP
jgi:Xaa-Pro aminopeptidase